MRTLLLFLIMLGAQQLMAQVRTYPLQTNARLQEFHRDHPDYRWGESSRKQKWGRVDTLSLPFFDEFNQPGIYPDSSKWLQNQVYVNTQFGYYPPTLGVATFDVLDATGQPYNGTINKEYRGPGDSLLSQPINLEDSAGIPYTLADSLVLSFYIQANGYGYHLNETDSIILFFKNRFDQWFRVWAMGGTPERTPFEQVHIPIEQSGFLHPGFQFLFTTKTRQVGNANHWNLDYVLLDKDRSVQEYSYADYAIQGQPTPLLKNYCEMPLSHFLDDPLGETADSVFVWASNLDSVQLNIQFRYEDAFDGQTIHSTSYGTNNVNIPALSSSIRRSKGYSLDGVLSGPIPATIERQLIIREAGVLNRNKANDTIFARQVFSDYFAHDDGSAEQGFGFDENTNPSNIPGEVAYRFRLNHPDTLYAIGAFFNRAVFDGSTHRFKFRVWQKIGTDGSEDVVLYESEQLIPAYMDRINRFSIHYLTEALLLPAGTFYIGWSQETMFNLNIGWDRNSGNAKEADVVSQDLYYKLFGQWRNDGLPYGELMMRPYVGSQRSIYSGIREASTNDILRFYPNPASTQVHFSMALAEVLLHDQWGQIVRHTYDTEQLDVSGLAPGTYFISGRNLGDHWLHARLLIFAP